MCTCNGGTNGTILKTPLSKQEDRNDTGKQEKRRATSDPYVNQAHVAFSFAFWEDSALSPSLSPPEAPGDKEGI